MSVKKAESFQSSLPANDKLMATVYKYNDPVTDTECIEFHCAKRYPQRFLAVTIICSIYGSIEFLRKNNIST
jgi:hypothetical protein